MDYSADVIEDVNDALKITFVAVRNAPHEALFGGRVLLEALWQMGYEVVPVVKKPS